MDESILQALPALRPGFRETALPTILQQRPEVRGRFFYVMPPKLLASIERPLGKNRIRFDEGKWAIEHQLTEGATRQSDSIGFFDGQPLQFGFLEPSRYDESMLDFLTEAQGKERAVLSVQALNRAKNDLQAYLGWLLTNPQFILEHRHLFQGACNRFLAEGMPCRIGKLHDTLTPEWNMQPVETPQMQDAVDQLVEFCQRWGLVSLTSPFLPNPLPPQCQETVLNTDVGLSYARQDGTRMISVPVTVPLPTSSDLRSMVEMVGASAHSLDLEHLNEWMALASPKSHGELQMLSRFGRIFRLQHYWRILYKRHSEALEHQIERLRYAFADFMEVSDDTIKDDLRLIKNRLGADWVRDELA